MQETFLRFPAERVVREVDPGDRVAVFHKGEVVRYASPEALRQAVRRADADHWAAEIAAARAEAYRQGGMDALETLAAKAHAAELEGQPRLAAHRRAHPAAARLAALIDGREVVAAGGVLAAGVVLLHGALRLMGL